MPNIPPSTQSSTSSSTPQNHIYTNQRLKSLLRFSGMINPSSNLTINLVEPILFMRGSPQESMGCFLRGELCLNLSKPTKIKKIKMKFIGRLKTFWPEGKISYDPNSNRNNLCEKRKLITHDWTFLEPVVLPNASSITKYHLLPAGVHTYPFELFLPGNFPETIEASRGTVTYKLVANVVRQGLSPNINTTRYVPIVRIPADGQDSEGISVSRTKGSLNYEISIPRRAYTLGDAIEIDVKLRPTIKNLRVTGAKIQLNEESTYKAGTQEYKETKLLGSLQIKGRPSSEGDPNNDAFETTDPFQISEEEDEGVFYQKRITFLIPRRTSLVHYSCESYSIVIAHKLRFTFTTSESLNTGILKKKKKAEIKLEVPVTLLSCRCILDELPTYEEIGYPEDNSDGDNMDLDGDHMSERSEGSRINDPFRLERMAMELPPSYDFQ